LMKPVPVVSLEEMGFPSDAKEAIAFAVLANETVHGIPSNVPGVTGARQRAILGSVTPGSWGTVRRLGDSKS
jgi:anhydro-N-acetylmuramic acid kinase